MAASVAVEENGEEGKERESYCITSLLVRGFIEGGEENRDCV